MRLSSFTVALGLFLVGPALPRCWGAGFSLFRNFWGNVIVSTDATAAGRALTPPTPEHPVYYLGRSLGTRLGTISGDELPDAKELLKIVTKILAKQGYVGARPGVHDPSLYLIVQWGYMRPRSGDRLWFLGYNPRQDIARPSSSGILGPEVFLRDFRSRETETILQSASDSIYGIIVTAFEYKSARTPTPVIYWQTRIGLPAIGKSMAQALPTMLLAAGPVIGRETDKPVLRDADNAREGRVDLGEIKVIDLTSQPTAPDTEAKNPSSREGPN
jgi:hypothetical protein